MGSNPAEGIELEPRALLGVARVKVGFVDGVGNKCSGIGTGFWLLMRGDPERQIFVTNKHVVDRRLIDAATPLRTDHVEIELRGLPPTSSDVVLKGPGAPDTKFHGVANLATSLFIHEVADCAIICDPTWVGGDGKYMRWGGANVDRLAGFHAFNGSPWPYDETIALGEKLLFIGYPRDWWDDDLTLPIVRECSVASMPHIPFANQHIKTADVLLVSGLSFQGSSGSPVYARCETVRPWPIEQEASERPFFEPIRGARIIGLMSGHFREPSSDEPDMFRHGGLSYLTRSTSIIELIEVARNVNFRSPSICDALEESRANAMASQARSQ